MFRVTYVNGRRPIAGSKMTEHEFAVPDLPSEHSIDRLVSVLEPVSRIVQPKLYGVENLPTGGLLPVGTHTVYGLLDLPFMMAEIWTRNPRARRARAPRGSRLA
jgi:hypothetical protein